MSWRQKPLWNSGRSSSSSTDGGELWGISVLPGEFSCRTHENNAAACRYGSSAARSGRRRHSTCLKKVLGESWMQCKELGIQNQLYEERLESDTAECPKLLRVPHDVFVEVLDRDRPRIHKQTKRWVVVWGSDWFLMSAGTDCIYALNKDVTHPLCTSQIAPCGVYLG